MARTGKDWREGPRRAKHKRGRARKDKGCTGKLRYASPDGDAAKEIERARTYRGETLRAYPCAHCGNWHLTSAPFMQWIKPPKRGKQHGHREGPETHAE